MKISKVETFLLHVPVTGHGIADSTHQVSKWGLPGVILHTDTGLQGIGYTGTHAHLPTDCLIIDAIKHTYGPLLVGEEAGNILHLWQKLHGFPPGLWVGRGGILKLALAAVDIALWDLKAKAARLPLWRLLGGTRQERIEAYNTDCGWLNLSMTELVDSCRKLVEEDGWLGLKIKVGNPNPLSDLDRIQAVRKAVGPKVRLMVDANGAWSLPKAIQYGRRLAEYDITWLEEPLWYDDVQGHAQLAQRISTPIALGEQLDSIDNFREFVTAGALHYAQPDATRLGGITEWWQVADLALAHRVPVAPHAGDMVQIHLQLVFAHPACMLLEYIPWLAECFEEPVIVRGGYALPPVMPGAGTTLRADARDRFEVPLERTSVSATTLNP